MPLAALPESAGGADAEWSDLYAVLRVAGRYAAPIPLAETMLAGWIAAAAGLELTDQPMTVGPVRAGDTLTLERDGNGWRLSGRASRLPYARAARRIVLIADGPDGEMAVALDGTEGAEHDRRPQHGRRTEGHAELFPDCGWPLMRPRRCGAARHARRCIAVVRWRGRR